MPEKISILKESGETLSSNVVSVFMIPDTEKKYIITTENAVDPHGLTVLHVSEIVDDSLQKIATDDEWSSIKTIMRAIISGNVGSYQYLPTFESIKASSQYSRDISVSASAAKQMMDNYSAGEKSAVNMVSSGSQSAGNELGMMGAVPEPTMGNGTISPSSIFPANGTAANSDYEVVPGIAEMPNDGTTGGTDFGVVQPTMPESPVAMDATLSNPPMMEPSVQPSVPPVPAPSAGAVNPMNVMMAGMEQNITAQAMPSASVQPVAPMPAADVQVAQPTQVVPTGQIVQEAQPGVVDEVKLNPNAEPNFAPEASLDELVAGSRDIFVEGVKNLVKTIQEKVYRDLYAKEAELKQKEAELTQKEIMLEQKEKMVNDQMMLMMSNFASMQVPQMSTQPVQIMQPQAQVVQPQVVQQAMPTAMVQPTVVQAANDTAA